MPGGPHVRRLCLGGWLLCAGLAATVAGADQDVAALDGLFDRLQQAETAEQAADIEAKIWQAWFVPPEPAAGRYLLQVESAMQSRELDDALRAADQLVERFPDFAEGWNRRATVRYLLGEFDGSVADIERTLILEPRHFGAMSGLGLIFLRLDDLPGALGAFEAALEISPASRSARAGVERVRTEMRSRDI